MSYILEALKKTDQEEGLHPQNPPQPLAPGDAVSPATANQPISPEPATHGLSSTWKIILGTFAAMNIALLGLLYSNSLNQPQPPPDNANTTQSAVNQYSGTSAKPAQQRSRSSNPVSASNIPDTVKVPPKGTRVLPGIASPRLTPAPPTNTGSNNRRQDRIASRSGPAPRIYGPSSTADVGEFGTAPTDPEARAAAERAAIAAAARLRSATQTPSSSSAPDPFARRAPAAANPSSATAAPPAISSQQIGPSLLPEKGTTELAGSQPATATKQLVQLQPDARARLQNLNFSTHIYGADADLRAVVVNGIRVVEGQSQGGFLLRDIVEDGVIIEFEHGGVIERVMIPVLEDWKD